MISILLFLFIFQFMLIQYLAIYHVYQQCFLHRLFKQISIFLFTLFSIQLSIAMADPARLNQALFDIDDSNSLQNLIDLNQRDSFHTTRFKPETWHNLNVYEDEDSDIYLSSSENIPPIQQLNDERYFQDTKKALAEYKQLKNTYITNQTILGTSILPRKFNRGEEPNSQEQQIRQKKKKKKIKKNKKKERRLQKRSHKKHSSRQSKKLIRKNNLKNISQMVCHQVQISEKVTYGDLFDKFIGKNSQDNKNLKRRMYDVINVLSSAGVIDKRYTEIDQETGFKRIILSSRISNEKQEVQQKKIHANKLKYQVFQKRSRVEEKKKILQELLNKKLNLQKLERRNQGWKQTISLQNQLHFPLYFYEPKQSIQMNVTRQQVVWTQQGDMHDQKQLINCLTNEIDLLGSIRLRKKKLPPATPKILVYQQPENTNLKFTYKNNQVSIDQSTL